MKRKKALENELKSLKSKMIEYQKEHVILSSTNNLFHSGLFALLGDKKVRNVNKALKYLKISSDRGNRYSSCLVGILYESGEEVEQNIEESFKYYEKASKQGDSDVFY